MKIAERIKTKLAEKKIDFADIEAGLLKDLRKLDKKAADKINKMWGMDQVWGISGSITGPSFARDKDHEDMFNQMVKDFGKDKEEQLKDVLSKWAYDYSELKDGTQPW